jgi:hypothetical protein
METILKEIEEHLLSLGLHIDSHNIHTAGKIIFITIRAWNENEENHEDIIAEVQTNNISSQWKLYAEI